MANTGYKFPVAYSNGSSSDTLVDVGDHFVRRDLFSESYLYAWGIGTNGALGTGNIAHRSSPVQVGSLSNWKTVTNGGYGGMAVKTDGTLWSWGVNTGGQLGLGGTEATSYSSPVQVGSLSDWKFVSRTGSSGASCFAIKTNGSLWAWGSNGGVLGLGDLVHRSSPVQLGADTNWRWVGAGAFYALGLKTDGTLWSWGTNATGALGQNISAATQISSPVQIGSKTNWRYAAKSGYSGYAVNSLGQLWAWGQNDVGQLGQGNLTHRSSPIQLGAGTNWSKVFCGVNQGKSVLAIKTDGTLWAWGQNQYGQLGLGDSVNRSSPVQVGSLANWYFVGASEFNTLAIKTDGSLWAWGDAQYGVLGIPSLTGLTHVSSPVQVGTSTNWVSICPEQSNAGRFAHGILQTD